jgi:chromosome segregation ATPase
LSSRRRSTIRQPRSVADELPGAPKTVELEQRLSRLEGACAEMQDQLSTLSKRLNAIQAQLDYVAARLNW